MVRVISEMLKSGGIEDYNFEAGCIMAHICGKDWQKKLLFGSLMLDFEQQAMVKYLAERRIKGEPLQYILGEWEFYGYTFKVGKGVLIPRQDTETLVETALSLMPSKPKVVDLCSGTGCIPIVLSKLKAGDYTAIEKFDEAYRYLAENIRQHGGVKAIKGDVLDISVAAGFSHLDLITANPPYLTEEDMATLQSEVRQEPATALYGGKDGLHFYREIARLWKPCLKSEGYIIFEVGVAQGEAVAEILRECGYTQISLHNDFTHRVRCVSARST